MSPYTVTAISWIGVLFWIGIVIAINRKTHPKALFYLFFVEMWERFSYYGMRALLVLYMTAKLVEGGLGHSEKSAYGIYAAYGALVYLTPLLGGLLAEKVVGYRKAIVWGAFLMMMGQFGLMIKNPGIFFAALALLVLGNGFFKPNISSLIGKLYKEGDPARDGGFTIFYMGINVGAFLTGVTCGTVGQLEGWHYGFGLAGVGMALGLIIFYFANKSGVLEDKGYIPESAKDKKLIGISWQALVYIGTFFLIPLVYLLLVNNQIMDIILGIVGIGMIAFILWYSSKHDKVQMQRLWVIVVLLIFTTMFWTFFELAGSALNLFTDKNISKDFFGVTLATSNFQSFNPLFVFLFAPLYSWLWIKLGKLKVEPAAPIKFGFGLILLGCGFLILVLGKSFVVAGMMPAIFMVLLYLLHTLGELTLSPIGLSLVTKLAPKTLVAFLMGFWFLSSSIAHQAGKFIAYLTAVDETVSVEQSLEIGLNVFGKLGLIGVSAGIFLFLISPILTKWMHGIK